MVDFHFPTRLKFGRGVAQGLRNYLAENWPQGKILWVTDQGIRAAGLIDSLLGDLAEIEVFDEVEANPKSSTIDRAACLARRFQPAVVVGIGGGSVLDAAKAIALLVTNPGTIASYEGRRKYIHPPVPVVAVPTTCGTGSEVTWVAVVTDENRKFKMSIKGPEMFPHTALVDPDTLLTLPSSLVASTGLDALTHAIEALNVKPATYLTDLLALEAIKLIITSLKDAYLDIKNNHQARERIMLGSTVAGLAFGQSDVGAVHCLSEALGAWYDLPHGVTNAIFLPLVMEFNFDYAFPKYARAAYYLELVEREIDERSAARELVNLVASLTQEVNIPSVKELGIKESDFPHLAQKAEENNSNPSNPRPATQEDYLALLKKAWGR